MKTYLVLLLVGLAASIAPESARADELKVFPRRGILVATNNTAWVNTFGFDPLVPMAGDHGEKCFRIDPRKLTEKKASIGVDLDYADPDDIQAYGLIIVKGILWDSRIYLSGRLKDGRLYMSMNGEGADKWIVEIIRK